MFKVKSFQEVFSMYEPYLLEETISDCNQKHVVQNAKPLSEEEKHRYIVEGYVDLSIAVFTFLHSGYGGYVKNYVSQYKVNRLLVGFQNPAQLFHFALFVLELYAEGEDRSLKSLHDYLEKAKTLSKEERQKRYVTYNSIMTSLRNNPFPPNRFELLDTLRENENLDMKVRDFQRIFSFIDPIVKELELIGEEHIQNFLKVYDPAKEEPTNERFTTVTRNRG